MLPDATRPRANPAIVLREEFDDWTILFDPDSGDTFGLNAAGVLVWKCLDGRHSIEDILKKMEQTFENVSANAKNHIEKLIKALIQKGLAQ